MINWNELISDWDRPLSDIINSPTIITDLNKINVLYKSDTKVYPDQLNVFKAFAECSYKNLSVVIIGQDPYHDGSATGLAFANNKNSKLSPSLRIIKDTISQTVYKGFDFDFDPTLVSWANQGVLLLNSALTVEKGKPLSHMNIWNSFISLILIKLSTINSGIIYCLWGKHAQSYEIYINSKSNTILKDVHPMYSIYKGTPWNCNHFIEINKQLKKFHNTFIKW